MATIAQPGEQLEAGPGLVRRPDEESQAWIARLNPRSAQRADAIEELRGLLLKAARFELNRRREERSHLREDDHDDLANRSADDALAAVLGKLDEFRGGSRFTTWACKFALVEMGVRARRSAWLGREILFEPDPWSSTAAAPRGPQLELEATALLGSVQEAIRTRLTPHQRSVLLAVTVDDVPIDVLAERLETTRGALYGVVHEARRKLRAALAADGRYGGSYAARAGS